MKKVFNIFRTARYSTGMLLAVTTAMLAVAATDGGCRAQTYPNKPIKLVVPFIAGSPVDALARVVVQNLQPRLSQSIVIENQSGAGGTLGSRAVANAPADGYTLLFAISSHTYGLFPNPGYDPVKSFTPVSMIAQWSHVLVVKSELPVKTLPELIAYAKANPGKVTFGYGINTPPQVLGETLKRAAGVDIRSIPYRGGAQAIQDMLGGRIDMNFGSTSTLLPLIKSGKLKAIAYTGATRSPDLPEVPTVAEAGYSQIAFNPDAWAVILAPAGSPPKVVNMLNAKINDSLQAPELRASFAKFGFQERQMSPQELASFLAAEMKRWPPVVQAAGLKAQ